MNAFSLCAFACRSMISFTFSGCPGLPIATANCSNVSIRSAGWLGCCSAAGVVDLGGSMRAVTLERFCRLGARTGCWGGLTTASWPAGPFLWLRVRTRDPDGGEVGRISCVQGGAVTTTSGPAWWASAFGTIIEGAGAVRVPAGCYDLCTLFKADSVTVLVLYCISSYCEFLSHCLRRCSGLFGAVRGCSGCSGLLFLLYNF